jgi:hypothetical protein
MEPYVELDTRIVLLLSIRSTNVLPKPTHLRLRRVVALKFASGDRRRLRDQGKRYPRVWFSSKVWSRLDDATPTTLLLRLETQSVT